MKNITLILLSILFFSSCFKKEYDPNAKCPISGMEGDDCKTETREKLVGIWKANKYNPAIAKASATTDVLIFHFAGFKNTFIPASFDGNKIEVNARINDTVNVSGIGEVYKDDILKINWTYILNVKGNTISVNENWVEL